MTTTTTDDPFNMSHLPTEILCKIFDYSTIDAVKSASLVCHRWDQIIFSKPYIKRFKLVLNLNDVDQMLETLKNSDRDYNCIVLRVTIDQCRDMPVSLRKMLNYVIRMISQYSPESLYFNMEKMILESCVCKNYHRRFKLEVDEYLDFMTKNMILIPSILSAINESAPDVEKLVLDKIDFFNTHAYAVLPSLTKLKHLIVRNYASSNTPSSPVVILPQLENLSLINVTVNIIDYFQADILQRFSIRTSETDVPMTMRIITRNISRDLIQLCVHFTDPSTEADQIFELLQNFPNLRGFELGGVSVPTDVLKAHGIPQHWLHKLTFVQCRMESLMLAGLRKTFRLLWKLEFESCSLSQTNSGQLRTIGYEDLDVVRRAMPTCQVYDIAK
ncbi:hypothetical protein RP20_CCG004616 [Aedes albopictus]|nr:hypothetical protein RP20_CCG004616 [Aedes albopictus]